MSAPAQQAVVSPVRWSTLPDSEPPPRIVPPECDVPPDPDDPTTRWYPPRPATGPSYRLPPFRPPKDCPVWDEAGAVRDRLARLLYLVLEVLDGLRPITHLNGAVDPHTYESLRTRSRLEAPAGRRHRLRSLHTCRPAAGVLELCATVAVTAAGRSPKAITIAGRVVRQHGRWTCTYLRPLYR